MHSSRTSEKLMHFDKDFIDVHPNQDFNQMEEALHFSHLEILTKQRYHVTWKMETLVKKRGHVSMKTLTKRRNHLRKMVSFHFIPIMLMHVRKDFHFTEKIAHLQLYALWALVAQEPGHQESSGCILQIRGLISKQCCWYETHPTSSIFFLCKLSTVQVYRQDCHSHVRSWMEYPKHRVRHCRRR